MWGIRFLNQWCGKEDHEAGIRYEMKLVEREDKTESINGTDIDMEPVFDKRVKELLKKQNGLHGRTILFLHRNTKRRL